MKYTESEAQSIVMLKYSGRALHPWENNKNNIKR